MTYQDRKDIDNLYEMVWDKENDQSQFITREEFEEFQKTIKLVETNIALSGDIPDYEPIILNDYEEIEITARFLDNDNNDGMRPTTTTVNVDDQKVILSQSNDWNSTLNIKAGATPKLSSYVEDYATNITDYENKYLVEYIHSDETIDVGCRVHIDKGAGFDMTFKLYKNNELYSTQYGQYVFNNYGVIFYDLPVYDNGVRNQYMVEVDPVEGYRTPVMSGSQEQGYTAHLIKNGGSIIIEVELIVDRLTSSTILNPAFIEVSDENDNSYYIYPRDFTKSPQSSTLHYIGKYVENFDVGTYTITPDGFEDIVPDCALVNPEMNPPYEVTILENGDTHTIQYAFVYQNNTPEDEEDEPVPLTTRVAPRITWNDNNDYEGLRPSSITAYLYAGNEQIDSCILNSANDWTYVFDDLPSFSGDTPIHYSVNYSLANKYSIEIHGYEAIYTVDIERVVKRLVIQWDDAGYESNRPSYITATLSPNGFITKPSPVNNWDVIVIDLPKYDHGQEVNYVWDINQVQNYIKSNTEVGDKTTTITLKYYEPNPYTPSPK